MKDWSNWKQDFDTRQKNKDLKHIIKTSESRNGDQDHPDFHSPDAFCGSAGPEELKHLAALVDTLTDGELCKLVDAVGIKFGGGLDDVDRMTLEGVVDEARREDFYREFHKIVESRKKS